MHAWHIYSYTWQVIPLLKCPTCPEWPKRGVKCCLVTFKSLLITEWGDGKLPGVGLGQKQVRPINQRRNSFLSNPPDNTYVQLWICERKGEKKKADITAVRPEKGILTVITGPRTTRVWVALASLTHRKGFTTTAACIYFYRRKRRTLINS